VNTVGFIQVHHSLETISITELLQNRFYDLPWKEKGRREERRGKKRKGVEGISSGRTWDQKWGWHKKKRDCSERRRRKE